MIFLYTKSEIIEQKHIGAEIWLFFLKNVVCCSFCQNYYKKQLVEQKKSFHHNAHIIITFQIPSVCFSFLVLVKMHNYKLADNAHLRVSFSKKGL